MSAPVPTTMSTPSHSGGAIPSDHSTTQHRLQRPRERSTAQAGPTLPKVQRLSDESVGELKKEIISLRRQRDNLQSKLRDTKDALDDTKKALENEVRKVKMHESYIRESSQRQVREHVHMSTIRRRIVSKAQDISRSGNPHIARFLRKIGSNLLDIADRMLTNVHVTDYQSLANLFDPAENTDHVQDGEADLGEDGIPMVKKRKTSSNH